MHFDIRPKPMTIEHFATAKRRGLHLTVFASREEDVEKRVKWAVETVAQAEALTLLGRTFFQRIDILVPAAHTRWVDRDCGKTKDALVAALKSRKIVNIQEDDGDIFAGIRNMALAIQSRNGIDYLMTLSPDARSYMNQETIDGIVEAVCDGATVVGVAIGEIKQSILAGRIAATFALWNVGAMISVGGFDIGAAGKTIDEKESDFVFGTNIVHGTSPVAGDVSYALAGVEEMVPLASLVKKFGQCIAPILPRGEGVKHYQMPDPIKEREAWLRAQSKFATKYGRQLAHLHRVKRDLTYLWGGVMTKYQHPEAA